MCSISRRPIAVGQCPPFNDYVSDNIPNALADQNCPGVAPFTGCSILCDATHSAEPADGQFTCNGGFEDKLGAWTGPSTTCVGTSRHVLRSQNRALVLSLKYRHTLKDIGLKDVYSNRYILVCIHTEGQCVVSTQFHMEVHIKFEANQAQHIWKV